ncbi:hypothetical protein CU669_02720 [Paramagnetospirillum kuznetsovii]|uniref:Lipoprotein n=1 Tax=Paramagnetospirillum kuznetsovii TaxID=2053833 RepID=A0A364P1V4_9PROT|nr:hypothetical protein [Paramagnetospirillum kuznetsovii]RAU23095.1 hypothetical protein CU669_02720 [Paramagnetospirillum kuznetsovii]
MIGIHRAGTLSLVLAACAALAACDGDPSDADMKAAVEQTYGSINKELGSVGKMIGKDLTTTIKAFKKLGCAKAEGNPGYRCDFEMTLNGPLGEKTEKASGRFVKGDKGWAVMEK